VESLQRLCNPEAYILYYPGKSLVDSCCPVY
jgi:hypothetical protein